jgi:putative membrane protein insertion efficiency factor
VAGAGAQGPRWSRHRAGRSGDDSRGTVTRAGAGGGGVALARAGDRAVTRARRLAWMAGAPARLILLGLIGLYRVTLSGWLGGQCRFYPSCSAYAAEAIRTHGAIRGSLLSCWRIARCGPFTGGGVDPVPVRSRTGRMYDEVIHSGASR